MQSRSVPGELVTVLADWWIEGEKVLADTDTVDHRAVRSRYTLDGLRARYPDGSRAVRRWFDGYLSWAGSYAARELDGWLRDALRTGRRTPDTVAARVRRDIAAALGPVAVDSGPLHRHEKFDPDAHLGTVLERGRAGLIGPDFGDTG